MAAPTFHVVPRHAVKSTIDDNRTQVFDVVEAAYRLLDLAVGSFVLKSTISFHAAIAIQDFFNNSARW